MITKIIYIPNIKDNITFYIGQSAQENFNMIDKAKSNDIWFHVHNHTSAHVIASIPYKLSRTQIHKIVVQGATLCKENSRFNCDSRVQITHCKISGVKKTDVLGKVKVEHQKYIFV